MKLRDGTYNVRIRVIEGVPEIVCASKIYRKNGWNIWKAVPESVLIKLRNLVSKS